MREFLLWVDVHVALMRVYFGLDDIYLPLEFIFFSPDWSEAALNSKLILKYYLENSIFRFSLYLGGGR